MNAQTIAATALAENPQVLLVDDDSLIRESLAFVLGESFDVLMAGTRDEALGMVRSSSSVPSLAVVDLGLPPTPHTPDEGFALVGELMRLNPEARVVVLSGQNDQANIQHALTLGAVDFVAKPCDGHVLHGRLSHQSMLLDAERATRRPAVQSDELVGTSEAMAALRVEIERFASTPFPVLVQGESGTGKELVAAALHEGGQYARHPFVSVNCAALTPDLMEAQLFGHAKGAFTGATAARPGFFEEADDGTLFLDEIGEFPLELQPKLLRVLENGEYYRVGETRVRQATARIVAATNRDLMEEIRAGRFRHDLYHRLSVLTIQVPALRARSGDSHALLDHFRTMYAAKVPPFSFDASASARWANYSFPGNVRELRNIVIRLGARYPGQNIGLAELEPELDGSSELDTDTVERLRSGGFRLDAILNDWEQRYIDAALKLSGGNLSEAARLLGVNRTTLYSKIQRLSAGD